MSLRQEIAEFERVERARAWQQLRLLPHDTASTVSAIVRRHPYAAMASVAVLTMGVLRRRHRRLGRAGNPRSWPLALAALGARVLPEILRVVGFAVAEAQDRPAGATAASARATDPSSTPNREGSDVVCATRAPHDPSTTTSSHDTSRLPHADPRSFAQPHTAGAAALD